MNIVQQIRLSHLSHGGGCGCKLAPSVLQQLLSSHPTVTPYKRLLVGLETGDDAAVWELDNGTCVIATTDFFMPMVDDPHDFGRIAATNAISDVYAMGGTPILALAILGMPVDKIPPEMVRKILEGGASVCEAAGIPIAGGHSIDSPEPIYGLAVIGTAARANIRRNSDARAGDKLILTKALGVGIYSAAFKKGALSRDAYDEFIASTTLLNRIGAKLSEESCRACHDRCDRFWPARSCAGNGARLAQDRNDRFFAATVSKRRSDTCPKGVRYRRVGKKLEELRHERYASA